MAKIWSAFSPSEQRKLLRDMITTRCELADCQLCMALLKMWVQHLEVLESSNSNESDRTKSKKLKEKLKPKLDIYERLMEGLEQTVNELMEAFRNRKLEEPHKLSLFNPRELQVTHTRLRLLSKRMKRTKKQVCYPKPKERNTHHFILHPPRLVR